VLYKVAEPVWVTISYALDNTGRTVRLCAILLTMGIASIAPFLMMALVRTHIG
jgi:hypothetical protein